MSLANPKSREPTTLAPAILLSVLAVYWFARAVAGLSHTMYLWGLNLPRFLPPWLAWTAWGLGASALIPALARKVATGLQRASRSTTIRAARLVFPLACASLVFLLSDRTWLTGDFLLRQGTAEVGAFQHTFANALPLELLLDRWLPLTVRPNFGVDPNIATRALEALLAGLLALGALALARAWGLRALAHATAVAVIVFGGYLLTFTGLGKPTALLCVLCLGALLGATRMFSDGRGAPLFGISVALAFITHRSSVLLLPLLSYVALRSVRSSRAGYLPWSATAAAIVPPLIALVLMAPRLTRIFTSFDLPRHVLPAVAHGTGSLPSVLRPLNLLDLANLAIVLTPALPLALLLAHSNGPRPRSGPPATVLLLLVASCVPIFFLIHPIQGVFRDLEVFAPAGLALSLYAAWTLGDAFQRGRIPPWLALPALVTTIVPTVLWLVHFHDPAAGLRRARAFAVELPLRDPSELAQLWDMISYRSFREHDWPTAVEATRFAVAAAPSKRARLMWAMARTFVGDYAGAESVYVALARDYPSEPVVWLGLGGVALRLRDSEHAAIASTILNSYAPGSPERRVVQFTARLYPAMWPSPAELEGSDRATVDADSTHHTHGP